MFTRQNLVQQVKLLLNLACKCLLISYQITFNENRMISLIGLFIPIMTTLIGTYKNKLYNDFKDGENTSMLTSIFFMHEITTNMIQTYFLWRHTNIIYTKAKQDIEVAKLKCAVKIPGVNIAEYNELIEHIYKLRDFIIVPAMIWNTLISFCITIYGIESYSSRCVIIISSLITLVILICINDNSLYERTKYSSTIITDLGNTELVLNRFSYGAKINYDHTFERIKKQEKQYNIQKIVVCTLNFVIIWISLSTGSKQYVLNFMSITWLISTLADNIKGLQYYSFVQEYLDIRRYLKQHEYKCSQDVEQHYDTLDFSTLRLDRISYGYLNNLKEPIINIKIKDLSFEFIKGTIYYIEAPNGVGKSTLLRTFLHNLVNGNIYFDNVNRHNLSWDTIHSLVFHLVQASEFCPKFRIEDINARKDADPYLINGLDISELFDKSSDGMSGGQKQRMNLYLALTSAAPIILLDEILSEISVIPSDEHPQGIRSRVIETILNWPNKQNKLIIIVGHGVFDNYIGHDVIKLKIDTSDICTKLVAI